MFDALHHTEQQLNQVLLGKSEVVKLALCCLVAGGHLLLEDRPGVGKTTLAHALAQSLGLSYRRVQFTNDLLPADLTGFRMFDSRSTEFSFVPGPIFHQVLLADEINRASSKSQSALLEAMEEHQVSVDGHTHLLPSPFFVIATQNPLEQTGTQPLPESQLDRFMMRLSLGFPDRRSELAMLQGASVTLLPQALNWPQVQAAVAGISVNAGVLDYLLDLVSNSRRNYAHPLSPRASKAILQAAKAWALLMQRSYVIPDDIQAVFVAVCNHRLEPHCHVDKVALAAELLATTPCPL